MVQGVRPETVPEPSTSGCTFGDGCGAIGDETGESNGKDSDSWTIADLRWEKPIFCRVANCPYWHTELKQVKRHRDGHFWGRCGFFCPNRADTCPRLGKSFKRRDAVNVHCRKSPVCADVLEANNGGIHRWGTPVTEGDLRPYNPKFHVPYKIFDGRTGRSCGKGQH